jgi:hypothetical protein
VRVAVRAAVCWCVPIGASPRGRLQPCRVVCKGAVQGVPCPSACRRLARVPPPCTRAAALHARRRLARVPPPCTRAAALHARTRGVHRARQPRQPLATHTSHQQDFPPKTWPVQLGIVAGGSVYEQWTWSVFAVTSAVRVLRTCLLVDYLFTCFFCFVSSMALCARVVPSLGSRPACLAPPCGWPACLVAAAAARERASAHTHTGTDTTERRHCVLSCVSCLRDR